MIAPARVAAYQALAAVAAGKAQLPAAIASARAGLHDDRDRALAADIVTGVQRWRAALDHLIVTFAKRPIERLDPEVVDILRLSAYQLLHHSRVPSSAVVDDAVNLVRRAGKSSAAGFVNAILRTISRKRQALPLPARPASPTDRETALDYLSITLSHPRWLAARWYDRVGFDATERWLTFNNTPAPLTLRANRLRTDPDTLMRALADRGVRVRRGAFAPDALVVEMSARPREPEEGQFVVQDEASQLVALLTGPEPGLSVLDACASPGGKTIAIAAAMRNNGLLVACDVRARRMNLLRKTVAESGATNVRLIQADLMMPLPFTQLFDCVMADVPCSGLGTLRRDPDIRWRRRESDLPDLAAAQRQMLRSAAASVRPGGRLVYATCSSEPEENESVVDGFLAAAPDFVAVDARRVSPSLPSNVVDDRGCLHTWPYVHGLEAFFGAVLERVP